MFVLILKIIAGIILFGLVVILFIKVLPFLALILAAILLWKLYQWLSRPKNPPRNLNWPY